VGIRKAVVPGRQSCIRRAGTLKQPSADDEYAQRARPIKGDEATALGAVDMLRDGIRFFPCCERWRNRARTLAWASGAAERLTIIWREKGRGEGEGEGEAEG